MMIKNAEEYRVALIQLDNLMDAKPGTEECEKLVILITYIEEYENIHFPIKIPLYIEAYVLIKTAINKIRFYISERVKRKGQS